MKNFRPEGRLIESLENISALKSINTLAEAMRERRILEARAVVCDSAHNLIVDLGGIKGIIPREEGAIGIKEGNVRDIAIISRVGKPVCFYVEKNRNWQKSFFSKMNGRGEFPLTKLLKIDKI